MSDNFGMRETDRWLRRYALMAPLITLAIGFMGGFISAAWLFRDLSVKVAKHDAWIEKAVQRFESIEQFEAKVSQRLDMQR